MTPVTRAHPRCPRPASADSRDEERTAEHRPCGARPARAVDQGHQIRPSRVLARLAARTGRSSRIQQRSARVVQQRLSRRLNAEPPRLGAIVITHDGDAGNPLRLLPRAGLLPAAGRAARLDEHDERPRLDLDAREQLLELAEAGARAVAARMREHHQRRRLGISRQRAVGRPAVRRVGADARRVVVRHQPEQSRSGGSEPDGDRDGPDQRADDGAPASVPQVAPRRVGR